MSPRLTVVVASHNRPEFIEQTIASILEQDYSDFRVVIAENSTDDRVANLLAVLFPQVTVRRRQPPLSSAENYYKILSELDSEYTMLFHDDDYLSRTDALSEMMELFSDKDIVAVAGNAFHLYERSPTNKLFFNDSKNLHFKSPKELFERYLRGTIAPFPSYIYKTSVLLKNLSDYPRFKKYNDIYSITSLAHFGHVAWVSEPVMYYRIHTRNDNSTVDIEAFKEIIKYGEALGISQRNLSLYVFPIFFLGFLKKRDLNHLIRAIITFLKNPFYITYYLGRRLIVRYGTFITKKLKIVTGSLKK
ncbi:MAG: glycosyltransferase family 2 protein [Bdellovibrionales bacterium]